MKIKPFFSVSLILNAWSVSLSIVGLVDRAYSVHLTMCFLWHGALLLLPLSTAAERRPNSTSLISPHPLSRLSSCCWAGGLSDNLLDQQEATLIRARSLEAQGPCIYISSPFLDYITNFIYYPYKRFFQIF